MLSYHFYNLSGSTKSANKPLFRNVKRDNGCRENTACYRVVKKVKVGALVTSTATRTSQIYILVGKSNSFARSVRAFSLLSISLPSSAKKNDVK